MRVLVTGANGHLGYNLVSALLAQGHQVRCLTRDPSRLALDPWRADVEVVAGVEWPEQKERFARLSAQWQDLTDAKQSLEQIMGARRTVAEGVHTARAIEALAKAIEAAAPP